MLDFRLPMHPLGDGIDRLLGLVGIQFLFLLKRGDFLLKCDVGVPTHRNR